MLRPNYIFLVVALGGLIGLIFGMGDCNAELKGCDLSTVSTMVARSNASFYIFIGWIVLSDGLLFWTLLDASAFVTARTPLVGVLTFYLATVTGVCSLVMASCRARDSTSMCHIRAAQLTFFGGILTFLSVYYTKMERVTEARSAGLRTPETRYILMGLMSLVVAIGSALAMILTEDYYWEYPLIAGLFISVIGVRREDADRESWGVHTPNGKYTVTEMVMPLL
jgi:hypothetical protein